MSEKFDVQEVLALLTIPEKVAGTAPQLMHITGEAMARLHKINDGLRAQKEEDAGQALTPDPQVLAASQASSPEADSDQLVDDPRASQPMDEPKSTVAEKSDEANTDEKYAEANEHAVSPDADIANQNKTRRI